MLPRQGRMRRIHAVIPEPWQWNFSTALLRFTRKQGGRSRIRFSHLVCSALSTLVSLVPLFRVSRQQRRISPRFQSLFIIYSRSHAPPQPLQRGEVREFNSPLISWLADPRLTRRVFNLWTMHNPHFNANYKHSILCRTEMKYLPTRNVHAWHKTSLRFKFVSLKCLGIPNNHFVSSEADGMSFYTVTSPERDDALH